MDYIHSGSTLLNLLLTGRSDIGYPLGRVSNIYGDKSTGKTLVAIEAATMLYHQTKDKSKQKTFYFESEAAIDNTRTEKLTFPENTTDVIRIRTIEDLYKQLLLIIKNVDKSSKNLVVVDSLDALTTEAEQDKEFGAPDYPRKAKELSELFRILISDIEQSNIHLMLISQIRDNLNATPFSKKTVRFGGRSLDFYTTHIIELAERSKLKAANSLVNGFEASISCIKNKIAPNYRSILIPIRYAIGLDEVDSIIRYLTNDKTVSDKYKLSRSGAWLKWDGKSFTHEKFVQVVQSDKGMYKELVTRVQSAWNTAESDAAVDRIDKKTLFDE